MQEQSIYYFANKHAIYLNKTFLNVNKFPECLQSHEQIYLISDGKDNG